jgi:hypothetical protein
LYASAILDAMLYAELLLPISQNEPVYTVWHEQVKLAIPSWQSPWIQGLLSHSSISVTTIYCHCTPAAISSSDLGNVHYVRNFDANVKHIIEISTPTLGRKSTFYANNKKLFF